MGLWIKIHEVSIVIEHQVILICLCHVVQKRCFYSKGRQFSLFTGVAARETAQALRTLAQAARGVAASTKEPQAAAAMLDSAQYVMEGSAMLIHEAHQALVHPGDAESQQRLAQVARIPEEVIFVSHCSSQPTFHFLCLSANVSTFFFFFPQQLSTVSVAILCPLYPSPGILLSGASQ